MAQSVTKKAEATYLDAFALRRVQVVFAPAKEGAYDLLVHSELANSGRLGDHIVPPVGNSGVPEVHVFNQPDGVQIFAANTQIQVSIEIPPDNWPLLDGLRYTDQRLKRLLRQITPIIGKDAGWLGLVCTYMKRLSSNKTAEDVLAEWLPAQGFACGQNRTPISFARIYGFRENGWNCNRRLEAYQTQQGNVPLGTQTVDVASLPIIESGIQFVTDVNDKSAANRTSIGKKIQLAVDLNVKNAASWLGEEMAGLK